MISTAVALLILILFRRCTGLFRYSRQEGRKPEPEAGIL